MLVSFSKLAIIDNRISMKVDEESAVTEYILHLILIPMEVKEIILCQYKIDADSIKKMLTIGEDPFIYDLAERAKIVSAIDSAHFAEDAMTDNIHLEDETLNVILLKAVLVSRCICDAIHTSSRKLNENEWMVVRSLGPMTKFVDMAIDYFRALP